MPPAAGIGARGRGFRSRMGSGAASEGGRHGALGSVPARGGRWGLLGSEFSGPGLGAGDPGSGRREETESISKQTEKD